MALTYQGHRIMQWREEMVDGEMRLTLLLRDNTEPSGRSTVMLTGREAASLKLASRRDIEMMPWAPDEEREGER